MGYLLKCKQTPQSLCRPEAAMTNDENLQWKEAHPPHSVNKHPGVKRQRIFWDSKNRLDLDPSTVDPKGPSSSKQINTVAPGGIETSLAGWWQTLVTGPCRAAEPALVQSTGRRVLPAPVPRRRSQHQRCGNNPDLLQQPAIKWNASLSVSAQERQLGFHFSYI